MIEPLTLPPAGPQYRELTSEEIKSVAHVFEATGNPLPDPKISTFVGCVDNGKVVGFVVLQAKLHAEPAWIEPGNSQVFVPMIHKAEEVILQKCGPTWVYAFIPAGRASQLAAMSGMTLEPWNIWSRLVMPEAPRRAAVNTLEIPDPLPMSASAENTPEAVQ